MRVINIQNIFYFQKFMRFQYYDDQKLIYDFLVLGIITIAQPLDYERAHDYLLTIQATDLGTPPLSNQATVNISVTDSNDNPPIFTQPSYSIRIPEDTPIGDIVLQVIYYFY